MKRSFSGQIGRTGRRVVLHLRRDGCDVSHESGIMVGRSWWMCMRCATFDGLVLLRRRCDAFVGVVRVLALRSGSSPTRRDRPTEEDCFVDFLINLLCGVLLVLIRDSSSLSKKLSGW
jgi:hypothetical protein